MLEVEHLEFAYDDLRVLWGVDLRVEPGEIVSVVGANGAGKTTLLKNISRTVTGQSAALRFDGIDLRERPAHAVVELGVVQVPEGRRIFPDMTVLENLRLGSYSRRSRADRAKNLDRVFALFPRLAERQSQLGGTMSGGEQQMLAIGRGLMANPRLLLLDEPSIGLAPLLVKSIFETIAEINRQGITIVLLEQNVYQSLRIANRAYVMELGRMVLHGSGAELAENEHVKKAFLGL
ncbi:MAG: ABC transporter ATP-binding protein [Polyangiales bacterium]